MEKRKEKRSNFEFEREDKGKEERKEEQEEKQGFKERAFGGTQEEKPLILQAIAFLGLKKDKRKQKYPKQQRKKTKTPFRMLTC